MYKNRLQKIERYVHYGRHAVVKRLLALTLRYATSLRSGQGRAGLRWVGAYVSTTLKFDPRLPSIAECFVTCSKRTHSYHYPQPWTIASFDCKNRAVL